MSNKALLEKFYTNDTIAYSRMQEPAIREFLDQDDLLSPLPKFDTIDDLNMLSDTQVIMAFDIFVKRITEIDDVEEISDILESLFDPTPVFTANNYTSILGANRLLLSVMFEYLYNNYKKVFVSPVRNYSFIDKYFLTLEEICHELRYLLKIMVQDYELGDLFTVSKKYQIQQYILPFMRSHVFNTYSLETWQQPLMVALLFHPHGYFNQIIYSFSDVFYYNLLYNAGVSVEDHLEKIAALSVKYHDVKYRTNILPYKMFDVFNGVSEDGSQEQKEYYANNILTSNADEKLNEDLLNKYNIEGVEFTQYFWIAGYPLQEVIEITGFIQDYIHSLPSSFHKIFSLVNNEIPLEEDLRNFKKLVNKGFLQYTYHLFNNVLNDSSDLPISWKVENYINEHNNVVIPLRDNDRDHIIELFDTALQKFNHNNVYSLTYAWG